MKAALLLLFVALATASPVHISEEEFLVQQLRNAIDTLIEKALEYVRWLLTRHPQFSFPPLPTLELTDDDIDLKFSTSDVTLSNAADFTVDEISNNLPKLHSSYGVTIPQAHLEGKYVVDGTAFKKALSGSGTFSIDITKLVQTGVIQFHIVDHSLQIETLTVDYKLDDAKFSADGLKIDGYSDEEVKDFLNKQLLNFLQNNKQLVTEKAAAHVTEVVNILLKGHSLQDVLDWVKRLVASTPDPPPFPTFPSEH